MQVLQVVSIKILVAIGTYLKDRELGQNSLKLLRESILCEHDLAHIERANTSNFEARVNYRRGFALRLRQHDIQKVICSRNRRDRRLESTRHREGKMRVVRPSRYFSGNVRAEAPLAMPQHKIFWSLP